MRGSNICLIIFSNWARFESVASDLENFKTAKTNYCELSVVFRQKIMSAVCITLAKKMVEQKFTMRREGRLFTK